MLAICSTACCSSGDVQDMLRRDCSRRGVNGTRLRRWGLQGYTQVCVADTRYLSIYLVRRARRNLDFYPPKLGDRPPTGELIAPLYHSLLLLQSPSLRTQLWPAGRRSPPSGIIVLWTAFYQAGGDGSPPSPVFGFI